MTDEPAILGFRQDRVGARLICILNVLRLGALFGVPARFAWLSQPGGPYPDLADPAEILSRRFVRDHLLIVDRAPDRDARESLPVAAGAMPVAQMAAQLAKGTRWFCDTAFEMTAFRDERAPDVAAQTAGLVADLPLAGPLKRALARARARLAQVGDGAPVAIHVRRGDILDGDPWSWTAWPTKYVPDEFFRAFVAGTTGPVVAFSDTPEAVRHLARGDPRIVPVGELIDDAGLSTARRDVLELLLMAGCGRIGAPDSSAFSRAAQVVGGTSVAALPAALPDPVRLACHDALLERAIAAPGSFFVPGDRAQCLHYAAGHAASTGRGGELVAACAGDHALLDRFPFLMGDLAALALNEGQTGTALDLAGRMRGNARLQRRDLIVAGQVELAARALAARDAPDPAAEADYLFELFAGRRAGGVLMPRLGGLILTRAGPAARALRLTPELVRQVAEGARPTPTGPDLLVPPWIAQMGWVELVESPDILRQLRKWPAPARKLAGAAALLAPVEAALAAGGTPPPVEAADLDLLGFAASALIFDNRLMRAMRLLEWLEGQRPDDAMTHKRMADACHAAGNERAMRRWLDSALERGPEDALLALSAAQRIAEAHPPQALELAERARGLWPGLALADRIARRLGGAKSAPRRSRDGQSPASRASG